MIITHAYYRDISCSALVHKPTSNSAFATRPNRFKLKCIHKRKWVAFMKFPRLSIPVADSAVGSLELDHSWADCHCRRAVSRNPAPKCHRKWHKPLEREHPPRDTPPEALRPRHSPTRGLCARSQFAGDAWGFAYERGAKQSESLHFGSRDKWMVRCLRWGPADVMFYVSSIHRLPVERQDVDLDIKILLHSLLSRWLTPQQCMYVKLQKS